MRAQRYYAGNQAKGILRIPERSPKEKSPRSPPQDAPPHDERVRLFVNFQERIAAELLVAMKQRDAVRVSTLRLVKSAFGVKEIEKRKTLTEAECLDVIQAEAKQRRESIAEYTKAGRQDLAAKEQAELDVLQAYLTQPLSASELQAMIQSAIASSGAKGPQDMGRVMSALMPEIKGRADGRQAQQMVQQVLSAVKP